MSWFVLRRGEPIVASRLSRWQWALLLIAVSAAWSVAVATSYHFRSIEKSFMRAEVAAVALVTMALVAGPDSRLRRSAQAGLRSAAIVAMSSAICGAWICWCRFPGERVSFFALWSGVFGGFFVGAIVGVLAMASSLRLAATQSSSTSA